MKEPSVTINGVVYDGVTGKALRQERSTHQAAKHTARSVHTQLQHSQTLSRRYIQQPAKTRQEAVVPAEKPKHQVNHALSLHRGPTMSEVKRSAHISRFTPTATTQPKQSHSTPDIKPVAHPLVQHVERHRSTQQPSARVAKPSDVIKREAIEQATAKMPAKNTRKPVAHKKKTSKFGRFVSVGSASFAVLLLGGYLTYLNMPSISTRVAATQAGISAAYPSYQPMGYSLDGPVAYKEGSVSMRFAANGGPESYTLAQTKSGWDSSATLENFVIPKAGANYSTTDANGLTIYTYGDNAVWVNNGILYTIDGDATLSNSQIQRIATSL